MTPSYIEPSKETGRLSLRGLTLYFDSDPPGLRELFKIVLSYSESSFWKLESIDCHGTFADELHQISDSEKEIPSSEIQRLFSKETQVFEGEACTIGLNDSSKILMRFIKGYEVDIETKNSRLLADIQEIFETTADLID